MKRKHKKEKMMMNNNDEMERKYETSRIIQKSIYY